MEEENVARQLSQVDNSVEEEFVTPVQVTANGLENHVSEETTLMTEETTLMTEETVQTSSSLSVTEIKSQTTFARQDTYTVEQVTAVEDVIPVEIDEDSQDDEIKTETDDDKVDDGNSEEPERIEENQNEIMSDEALTEEEVDEVDEASISSSGLQRQNTYTVKTVEVKESSSEVLERFTETQQLVQYKYDEEEQEEPLYKEPDEHLDTPETGEMRTDETVEVRKVVEDEYVTAEEVRTQKHRTLNTVTEVNTRGEPTIMEETSLASLASLANLASLKTEVQEDGLDRTSRDVDQLLKDIRDPNLDCSLEDIEAMIDGKDVRELKTETNNRGSPEFAKAAALIDQNPDKGFDPDDPAVKGLEDWECSNNLTTSFDTEVASLGNRMESRRYSNLMDLPGVNLDRRDNSWLDSQRASQDLNLQERRFFKDFRPFFLLCQLSGMFPYQLNYKLTFSWGYWATWFCLLYLTITIVMCVFYMVSVVMVVNAKAGLLYVAYNLAWVAHFAHCIDFILLFYTDRKEFQHIFQGYRKFYRYLLADRSDKSVISFTWKTFVAWELMFYITAALLVLKSYYDRFLKDDSSHAGESADMSLEHESMCQEHGYYMKDNSNRTVMATIDQLPFIKDNLSETGLNILFWINLVANIMCMNIVFLSEVFFMVIISIIFHAFSFIHKQIDRLLGNPDSIFSIDVVHEPTETVENIAENIVRKEFKAKRGLDRWNTNDLSLSVTVAPSTRNNNNNNNNGLTIRALWEQMEELIDLLEQLNDVFGLTLQFLSLEYLLLFPALLYFCIELYPTLSAISLIGFAGSMLILGVRSLVFTAVCARVNKEAVAPINTLYRAYVKGDVSFHDYELINMFIKRLTSTTIAVKTWSHVPITRQTFSIIFVAVFGILAALLQSKHSNI